MIAIALTFPAGRFHATPWGRNVNEGAPEWPPSPWRMLRSLVATWKRKLDDRITADQIRPVLKALAEPPSFHLPPASTGHTRHYMPTGFADRGDKTKVFDAFVALPRTERVVAVWPGAALDDAGRELLGLLLRHLGFLGRAESWCEAVLLDDAEANAVLPNCAPLNGEPPTAREEIVRVLCAHPSAAFENTNTPKIRSATGPKGARRGAGSAPLYDPDWHLCMETSELHDKRWSDPPGSVWVRYVRRTDCFAPKPTARRAAPSSKRLAPQVARFALDSTVLPLAQQTLPIAEQVRGYLMGIYGRLHPLPDGSKGRSEIFSGKSADGAPLEGHRHAYFLPSDEDGDGRLDHVTVYAEGGFGPGELKALDRLTALRREEGAAPLRLLLLALGRAGEFKRGPVSVGKTWVSATPFLVTRHPKRRGRKKDSADLLNHRSDFVRSVLEEELTRLCGRRGWDAPEVVEPLTEGGVFRIDPRNWEGNRATGPALRSIQFKRFRQKASDDGGRRPSGAFRIKFKTAVPGPICLGHSSHFGLGLFLPAGG